MKKEIKNKVEYLRQLTGLNLEVDFTACYGGYRLVKIIENGAHAGCFGKSSTCNRISAKEFSAYLDGLIYGFEQDIIKS
jgi:hypothetical protein